MAHLSTQCGALGVSIIVGTPLSLDGVFHGKTTTKRMRTGGTPIHYFRKPPCIYIYIHTYGGFLK